MGKGPKKKYLRSTPQAYANHGMQLLRQLMQFGVPILDDINRDTLMSIQRNLDGKKDILFKALETVIERDGKTTPDPEENITILQDPQPGLKQIAGHVAQFLQDERALTYITPKSAVPLLRYMKRDNLMEDNLLRRISLSLEQKALAQGTKAGAAGGSHDKLTPAGSAPDDSGCGKRTGTELEDIWKDVKRLKRKDLQTLNKWCRTLLQTSEKTTPTKCEGEGAAGAASGNRVGPEDGQARDENGLIKAQAWGKDAWHPQVKKELRALEEAKKVDIEKLEKCVLDNFKSLPFEVALMVLEKRMNTDENVRNENVFFQKNCDNLRSQWGLDSFEVEQESRDDDDDDDDDDSASEPEGAG
jgi:hypothetical protein